MFQGVWWDLILALLGGGLLTQGVVGLMMGGDLPKLRVPPSWKPLMKLIHTLTLMIGLTLLLAKGTPDLVERVVSQVLSGA